MKKITANKFLNAVTGYGELTHDEIMALTDGKPVIVDGKVVDSILDDDGLKYSYLDENGVAYSRNLHIDDLDGEILEKIYDYLCDNRNTNTDFFNSLC
jgi:hypothetical protein